VIPGSPPGVEYCGTPLGFSLAPIIRAMVQWSSTDFEAIEKAQVEFDERAKGDVGGSVAVTAQMHGRDWTS